MYFAPRGDAGVDPTQARPVVTERFEAETEAQLEAQIEAWEESLLTPEPGTMGTMDSDTIFGDCGYSKITVKDNYVGATRLGYLKSEFHLYEPGYAYSTDTLLFSSSAFDLWTLHVPRSGDLGGGEDWSTSGLFDVPKAQEYGGTLIEADVVISGGTCSTGGPHVDNVYID